MSSKPEKQSTKQGLDIESRIEAVAEYIDADSTTIDQDSLTHTLNAINFDINQSSASSHQKMERVKEKLPELAIGSGLLLYASAVIYLLGIVNTSAFNLERLTRYYVDGQLDLEALEAAHRAGLVTSAYVREVMDFASSHSSLAVIDEMVRAGHLLQESPNLNEVVALNAPMIMIAFLTLVMLGNAAYYLRHRRRRHLLKEQQAMAQSLETEVAALVEMAHERSQEQRAKTAAQNIQDDLVFNGLANLNLDELMQGSEQEIQ